MSWGDFAVGYLVGEQSGRSAAQSEAGSGSSPSFNLTQFWVMGALIECVVLVLITCGYISLFDFGLRLPVPVGLAATIIVIALYLALHGDRRTTLAMILLLTPAWTLGVYFWENPQARLHRPLLQSCPSIHQCVQHLFHGGNVKWGWTLCAFAMALLFRIVLYSMVRQRGEVAVPLWEGVFARTWMWLKRLGIATSTALFVALIVVVTLKACDSERKNPDQTTVTRPTGG